MAKQTVNVGTSASDGTGDELRVAFTKINENFTELYSGNVQITAANVLVYSVAGRTGNIELTVNDVAQAASKSYVNTAIAANLANVTSSITNSLSASITAANLVIANHEGRITTLESSVSTQSTAITSLQNTRATISYVDTSIGLALSSNAILANVARVNANVAAANLRIAAVSTQSNSNSQNITVLSANAGVQGRQINLINANVAAANAQIIALAANVGNFNGDFSGLQANAAIQAIEIDSLRANITAANAGIAANAIAQSLEIQSLQTDAAQIILGIGTLGMSIDNLIASDASTSANIGAYQTWSNAYAASQTIAINDLRANITAANAVIAAIDSVPFEIASLQANAAAQGDELIALTANAAAQDSALTILTANSVIQDTQINLLNANLTSANTRITTLTSNAATQAVALNTLTSNAVAQALEINSLWSNLGLHVGNLNAVNANIGSYQIWSNASSSAYRAFANANAAAQTTLIDAIIANLGATSSNVEVAINTKADIAGEIFTGNIQAPYVIVDKSAIVTGNIQVGSQPTYIYPNIATSFTSSIDGPYGVVIQNTSTGADSSSDLSLLADDGSQGNNRLRLYINGSDAQGTYTGGDGNSLGLIKFPHDGGFSVFGGNGIVASSDQVVLVANTAFAILGPDGTFSVQKLELGGAATFNSMTVSGGMSSTTGVAMSLDGNDVNVFGNIKLSGGRIRSASNVVMTLSGDDVIANNGLTVSKDLLVGGDIFAKDILSEGNITLYANTIQVSIVDDGTLHLRNANLKFRDGTIQQTAIEDVPALYGNIGTLFLGNASTNANLGAYQTSTNSTIATIQANLGSYQLYANANIGTLFLGNASTNANLGAFQLYANANIGTLFLGNASTNANLGAYQLSTNANIGTIISVTIPTINSNISAANAAIQTLSANIGTLVGGAGAALDTLLELGNALGNSDSFSSTIVNWLSNITANVTAANSAITTIDANVGTLFLGNASTNANLGAYQTYANTTVSETQANLGAYQTYANANIGTLFLGNASTNANLGEFQIYANANIGTLFLGNASTNANLGAFQLYANANIGTLFLGNASTNANLGAYQIFANANSAAQTVAIDSLASGANANTAAYLLTSTGNISAGNITVISNLVVGTGSSGNVSGVNYLFANNIATTANVVTGNIQITGNINYTPNTSGNYNQVITNMQQALNELAARVKALGG
jgi:uncharacterized coiled-coil protein SlyX/cytoskeletal protein CcmA (bactofilin family)